jgi:hypothetical protein
MEAAMPLIYLPLIMYASWMEFLAQPFKDGMRASDLDAPAPESDSSQ